MVSENTEYLSSNSHKLLHSFQLESENSVIKHFLYDARCKNKGTMSQIIFPIWDIHQNGILTQISWKRFGP